MLKVSFIRLHSSTDSEVANFYHPCSVQHDILKFNISVDNARFVNAFDSLQNLLEEVLCSYLFDSAALLNV